MFRRIVTGATAMLAVLTGLVVHTGAVRADINDPTQVGPLRAMTFPVVGRVSYSDTFGAPRSGGARTHEGQDIMGAKHLPLVATADGVVSNITIPQASYGYALTITDDEGWSYKYIHINNDTPGTDDGLAPLQNVYAVGIARGTRVKAGQLVAYLGDSGNAESTSPHLHFELSDPTGATVNPYASLKAARVVSEATIVKPVLPRLAGVDRASTAVEASRAGWPDGSPKVVIASGNKYAEALPASVLAAKLQAPLLLTVDGALTEAVTVEITRLKATHAVVVGSVPETVDAALTGKGLAVERIGSYDQVGTAVALAKQIGAADATAVLVNMDRFPDGVSAAGLAAGRGWPILLSRTDTVPQRTVDAWRSLGVTRILVVGGEAVITEKIKSFVPGGVRLAGADRYGTSVAAAEESVRAGGRSLATTYLTTGLNYPDALTAGSLAARTNGVVLLVDGTGAAVDRASREFLAAHAAEVGVRAVLGGYAAVSASADVTLAGILKRG